MHIFRFFEHQNFIVNQKYYLNKQNSHKIISVLRLKINNQIYLFNNTNTEFIAKIIAINSTINKSKFVEILILQANYKNLESPIKIHLVQSIAKNDNMDWIIQKSSELGVYSITPLITARTIVKISNDQSKKILHWEAIATEACGQCGRNIVPIINKAVNFKNFINIYNKNIYNKFILSPILSPALAPVLSQGLLSNIYLNNNYQNLNITQEIMLLIGPEGGFNLDELKLAIQHQFIPLTFGPRILRTETAPIVAISILQSKYGDLQ